VSDSEEVIPVVSVCGFEFVAEPVEALLNRLELVVVVNWFEPVAVLLNRSEPVVTVLKLIVSVLALS
jgi:hypothetical protein